MAKFYWQKACSARIEYVMSKVHRCMGGTYIKVLSEATSSLPQLAYGVFTKSLQHKWTFLLCVVPQCGQPLQELHWSLFLFPTGHVWY